MKFDVFRYANEYYTNIQPAEGNQYPRLKAWEFVYEYIWGDEKRSWSNLINPQNIDTTALHLGFYLANWGMFRGSSKLLKNSNLDLMKDLATHLFSGSRIDLLQLSLEDFGSDAPNFRQNQRLFDSTLSSFKTAINSDVSWTDTLNTKILLGVWGEFPALDTYYVKGCKKAFADIPALRKANGKGLTALADLISQNEFHFPALHTATKKLSYPKARILDMALFQYGLHL